MEATDRKIDVAWHVGVSARVDYGLIGNTVHKHTHETICALSLARGPQERNVGDRTEGDLEPGEIAATRQGDGILDGASGKRVLLPRGS
jgi:hypothetical protein